MYYSEAIMSKMASDKILALKLESALSGVKQQVIEQASRIQDGATRMAYYTSCFTDNYQDVCTKLKEEDVRFFEGLYQLFKDRKIISELILIYVELLLKNKNQQQLELIKKFLIRMNVNISVSSLSTQSFALAVTMSICLSSNMSAGIVRKVGNVSGLAGMALGSYGYIQQAADSAERLLAMSPAYHLALYMRKLEMMYFLVEPMFIKARVFISNILSEHDIANAIASVVR